MMERILSIAALALAASVMFSESALAKNVAVGATATCQPNVAAANRYATIQAAVNGAVAGDVVNVCPGKYPEQVVINKALTLKGVTDGVGNLIVIIVPAGGLAPNADSVSYGSVAAQVLVQNTSFVKVQNLGIDGTLPVGVCPGAGAYRSAGIFYQNVGVPADAGPSAGSVNNVVVENQADDCLGPGAPAVRGVGVLLENSNIAVTDSSIHTIRGDGIKQHGGYVDVTRNFFMDIWDYSVKITASSGSDVRTNTIIHSTHGVVVQAPATMVVSNVIGPYVGTGVFLAGGSERTLVQSNKMNNTTTGIWLNTTFGASVLQNIIYQAGTGIIDLFSRSVPGNPEFPQNVIKNNEVNEASFGMQTSATSDDVLTPNTYTNVGTLTAPY
jgi:nitrous oxidase accessory protein NosD